ncbi:helix-turn-helix domain-containing protein [Streptomyces sp. NPDC048664]|uniref:helix-turn-helix domain-containing protein n=1 Tax=Streptomyces sp. NPDC048664 TaxID=3154505 RepID=UPI00342096A1
MGTNACHHYAHGTFGARILAALDPLDGADVASLAAATGLHRTTVRRRLDKLVEDGLAEEADGLVYLPRHLAGGAAFAPTPTSSSTSRSPGAPPAWASGAANDTATSGAGTGSGSPNARSTPSSGAGPPGLGCGWFPRAWSTRARASSATPHGGGGTSTTRTARPGLTTDHPRRCADDLTTGRHVRPRAGRSWRSRRCSAPTGWTCLPRRTSGSASGRALLS